MQALNPIFYIVGAISLIIIVWLLLLERKIKRMLPGSSKTLEESIAHLDKGVKEFEKFQKESIAYLETVEKRLQRSIRGVETLRFNPFQGRGEGGNQSFTTAFLNEKGDGVVITSLYSRERVSVFSKPIQHFTSEHELSGEEKEAIARARESLHNYAA